VQKPLKGVSTKLSTKKLPQDPGFARILDIVGQIIILQVIDRLLFLAYNVWKSGQSMDLETTFLVLNSLESPPEDDNGHQRPQVGVGCRLVVGASVLGP
jgi:hypothetical protein